MKNAHWNELKNLVLVAGHTVYVADDFHAPAAARVARRKTNLMRNLTSGLTWEEVKRRIRSHYDH